MLNLNSPEVSRNYGFMNEAEQEAIFNAHVAIGGVGGDGFQLGLKLARIGVQNFTIADPEVFEPENSNRVPGATTSTYGRLKAEVFAENVHDINPNASVTVFKEGVTEENVHDFVKDATMVFDESELTYLHIGASIARAARERNIPDILVMNVGFAAQVTSFDPKSKHTFERMMGIPDGMPLDEVKDLNVDFSRCLPYVPKYADLKTLAAVKQGAPLPSIAEGVDVASAIGTSQAFLHMIQGANNRRPKPVYAPKMMWLDAYTGHGGTTRFPKMSHYRHLLPSVARNIVGAMPKASYTAADRARRSSTLTQG